MDAWEDGLRVAYIIFNDMTSLDLAGVFDTINRLRKTGFMPNLTWETCSYTKSVRDQFGLGYIPSRVRPDLSKYDLMVVVGGIGTRKLMKDDKFVKWLRTGAKCDLKTSVCTGALLLGAAGFLKGKRATTHHDAFHLLKPYCSRVVKNARIVDEGDVVTAGGVTSSIDLGLFICDKLAGKQARNTIQRQIEYDAHPQGA
jgi:cyclohexyl-isocyanide hydratase